MTKNELYEQEIKRISPKLEELKNKSFYEIMDGLYNEVSHSSISRTLIFALTYVLDPSKFYIEVDYWAREGKCVLKFTADLPLRYLGGPLISLVNKSAKRPTDKEARDLIKKCIGDRDKGGLEVVGLIKRAEEVVDTCKVIQT